MHRLKHKRDELEKSARRDSAHFVFFVSFEISRFKTVATTVNRRQGAAGVSPLAR